MLRRIILPSVLRNQPNGQILWEFPQIEQKIIIFNPHYWQENEWVIPDNNQPHIPF